MKINIKSTKIELKDELKEFVEKETILIERLLKDFFDKKEPKIEVWLEIGRFTRHHQKGPIFFAEYQMRIQKKTFRTEAFKENIKEAIVEARKELERLIKEHKGKKLEMIKRGARKFKKELKLSSLAKNNKKY